MNLYKKIALGFVAGMAVITAGCSKDKKDNSAANIPTKITKEDYGNFLAWNEWWATNRIREINGGI